MRILHIIKENNDKRAIELAETQREQGKDVTLILIHDAVLSAPQTSVKVFACQDDVAARGIDTGVELVDYNAIIDLVFACDSVTCW